MTGQLIRFLGASAAVLAVASVVPMVVGPVRAQTPVAFGTFRPTGPSVRPTFPVYTPDPNRPIDLRIGNVSARYDLLPTNLAFNGPTFGAPSQSLFRTPLRPIQFQGFVFNNNNQGGNNQGNNQGGFGGGGNFGGGGFGGGGIQGGFGGGGFGGGGIQGGFGGGGFGGGGIGGIGGGGIGGGGIGGIGGGQTQLFPQFPQRSFGGYNAIGITQYQTTQNIPPGLLSGGGGGLGGIGGGLGGFGGGIQGGIQGGFGGGIQGGFGGGQFGGGQFGGGQFGGGQFGGGQFGGGQFGGGGFGGGKQFGFGGAPAL